MFLGEWNSMMAKKIIAIVEDDEQQRSQYSQALRAQGYHVDEYSNRAQAEKMFSVQLPDLAILDIMLNHDLEGGFEICRFIEQIKPREVPILFLTSRGNEVDEIYGLNLGAWDYQTKPVTFEYLLARVRSLFNIKQGLSSEVVAISAPCQQLGPLAINSMTCKVTWHEQGVLLTPTEFAMLKRLLDCPDGVSYDGFSEATRQGVVENNTINTHIAQIRQKFKAVDSDFNAIKTRYGFGYKLSLE